MAAAPQALIRAMVERADELRDVEIVQLHTEGPAPYADPEHAQSFRVNALFVGANVRKAVDEGRADYVPVFLSEAPALFRQGILSYPSYMNKIITHVPAPSSPHCTQQCRYQR
jgi:acyl-CoA hydrolase